MKVRSERINNGVVFNNFIVIERSNSSYEVYEKEYGKNEPTGERITSDITLKAACKKAKMLQIGYDMGYKYWI